MRDNEEEIACCKCEQIWWVEAPPNTKKGIVKTLAGLTGYLCSECAGWDMLDWANPKKTMYPARKAV